MNYDRQYQNILKEILEKGEWKDNRTQFKTLFIPSATITHDMRTGFPAITTKKLFYKASIGEIVGFLRGFESAEQFRKLGCNIWNSDANENKVWLGSPFRKGEDDLGCVYGSTWRNREVVMLARSQEEEDFYISDGYELVHYIDDKHLGVMRKTVDQLEDCVNSILLNPNNRRNIMHAWFPELFPKMALPPCHVMYEFVADEERKVLHMTMTQRSCDTLLGVPFNLFGSALILALVARATRYTAGVLTHQMTDVHLYENQVEQAKVQIGREPMKAPSIEIESTELDPMKILNKIHPDDIKLIGYEHHPALERVEMAQENG